MPNRTNRPSALGIFLPPSLQPMQHAKPCGRIALLIHCAVRFRSEAKDQLSPCSLRARLLPKERPLADLAIKTVEKCRTLHAKRRRITPIPDASKNTWTRT